jgi:hypothetical protein
MADFDVDRLEDGRRGQWLSGAGVASEAWVGTAADLDT